MRKTNILHSLSSKSSTPVNGTHPKGIGLDFVFKGVEYRFCTGSMYKAQNTILSDGREAVFGLYTKDNGCASAKEYELIAEFATIVDAQKSTCINGVPFSDVIMDENTELLGQD